MKPAITRRTLLFLPQAAQSVPFVVTALPEFIVHGGIAVDTPFVYQSPDGHPLRFSFRTVIQIDSDVINFLPWPDAVSNDPVWSKVYEDRYTTHRVRVERVFAKLEGIRNLAWLFSGTLSLCSAIPIEYRVRAQTGLFPAQVSFLSLLVLLTIIFKRYLFRHVLRLALFLAGILARRELKRRLA